MAKQKNQLNLLAYVCVCMCVCVCVCVQAEIYQVEKSDGEAIYAVKTV
jgi:hypothetical protein